MLFIICANISSVNEIVSGFQPISLKLLTIILT